MVAVIAACKHRGLDIDDNFILEFDTDRNSGTHNDTAFDFVFTLRVRLKQDRMGLGVMRVGVCSCQPASSIRGPRLPKLYLYTTPARASWKELGI